MISYLAKSKFVVTKEYRRFAEFCDSCCRYRYIGLCYGPPGVGKTLAARHYSKWDLLKPWLDCMVRDDSKSPKGIRSCRTLLYTPTVANTPQRVGQQIDRLRGMLSGFIEEVTIPHPEKMLLFGKDYTELIIVDEADRLKTASLEQLRDTYDKGDFGMIFIGMPGIEKRLSRYPQLYSRVGFVHNFHSLSPDEVIFILKKHWNYVGMDFDEEDFTDSETFATIVRITGGNFRLLHRLLMQAERIMRINELQTLTKEVIETAREHLVIGVA